jgi:predicted nucleic acid-binding protein
MFLDTSGLMCLLDKRDDRHADALIYYRSANERLTSSYVIAELVALADARGVPRAKALDFVADIQNAPTVEVCWVDEELHRRAFDLLLERMDKTYSLCDAVDFVLMREHGITDALTTDCHFEQEGFNRLLAQ